MGVTPPIPFQRSTNQILLPEVGVEQRAKQIRRNLRTIGRYRPVALGTCCGHRALADVCNRDAFDGRDLRFARSLLSLPPEPVRTRPRRYGPAIQLTPPPAIPVDADAQAAGGASGISTEQHMLTELYLKLAMLAPLTGLQTPLRSRSIDCGDRASQRQKSSLTILTMDVTT